MMITKSEYELSAFEEKNERNRNNKENIENALIDYSRYVKPEDQILQRNMATKSK